VLPFGFILFTRLFLRFIMHIRLFVLIVFLFLIFSKEHLSVFYFFSLGWFLDLAMSFLGTFSLRLPDYVPIYFGVGYHPFNTLPWIREFAYELTLYRGHIIKNMLDIARVRAM
jgi:hypothetical protein